MTKLSSSEKEAEQSQHIGSTSDENNAIQNRTFVIYSCWFSLRKRDPINLTELRIQVGEPTPHRAHSFNFLNKIYANIDHWKFIFYDKL